MALFLDNFLAMAKKTGVPSPHLSEEEKRDKMQQICELYESQRATIESCCEAAGVSPRTFYLWRAQSAEFAEMYKKARISQEGYFWQDVIHPLAERALERLLRGERKVESKEEGEQNGDTFVVKKRTKTETEILPNAAVTIFTMKGLYPDKFPERHEITGRDGKPISIDTPPTIIQIAFRPPTDSTENVPSKEAMPEKS